MGQLPRHPANFQTKVIRLRSRSTTYFEELKREFRSKPFQACDQLHSDGAIQIGELFFHGVIVGFRDEFFGHREDHLVLHPKMLLVECSEVLQRLPQGVFRLRALLPVSGDRFIQSGNKRATLFVFAIQPASRTAFRRHSPLNEKRKEDAFFSLMMPLIRVDAQKFHHPTESWFMKLTPLIQSLHRLRQRIDDARNDTMFSRHFSDGIHNVFSLMNCFYPIRHPA